MADFNDKAVNDIFDRIIGYAMASGRFDFVNQHEPVNATGSGTICSIWIERIRPIQASGLNSTSGVLQLNGRIYKNFKSQPQDAIDPDITSAVCDLIGALSADFDFGGDSNVRAIDLLGMTGTPLEAIAGYINLDRQMFRVMTLTIPVIVDDMWRHGNG